jgi:hypothetical protein
MKRTCILAFLAAALMAAPPAQSPDVQFRAAQQKETVEGDLKTAIAMYRKLADDRGTPPDVAARALVRLGRSYQRLGNSEARKAFERVVNQFSAQTTAVAEAKQLLAAMPGNGAAVERGFVVRKLQSGVRGLLDSVGVTRDGKYMAAVQAARIDLAVLNLLTGEVVAVHTQQPVASGNEYIYAPAISPDGQSIAVGVPTGAGAELRLIERSTGQVRTLFKSDSAFRVIPDWSRDSRTILAQAGLHGGLLLIDIASGAVRSVPRSGEEEAYSRLSPDGQFIAYQTFPKRDAGPVAPGKIFVERVDGSGDQLIADPEWRRDAGRLVFRRPLCDVHIQQCGRGASWAVRVEGGRPRGEPVSLANDSRGPCTST